MCYLCHYLYTGLYKNGIIIQVLISSQHLLRRRRQKVEAPYNSLFQHLSQSSCGSQHSANSLFNAHFPSQTPR